MIHALQAARELRPLLTENRGEKGRSGGVRGRRLGRWLRWVECLRGGGGAAGLQSPEPPTGDRKIELAAVQVLVDRPQLLDQVMRSLPNNSLFLSGEDGVGKSTLLHRIEQEICKLQDPVWEYHAVPVSLDGVEEEAFFDCLREALSRALAVQLSGLRWMLRPPSKKRIDSRAFVRELRQVVRILDRQTSRKVKLVLLVDGIERLNHFDPLVNQRLRSLFMSGLGESLVAVVAGVSIDREWVREGSPWFNFFEEIPVGPLEEGEARKLAGSMLCGRLELEDGMLDRLVECSGCRAQMVVELSQALLSERGGCGSASARDLNRVAKKLAAGR